MPDPSTDRNLLFGVLALQNDFLSRDTLVAATRVWAADKARPLGQVLRDQGVLTEDERALLEGLVDKHLARHGNDTDQSLAAVASLGTLALDLQQLADPGAEPSATNGTTAGPEDDPFATRAPTVCVPNLATEAESPPAQTAVGSRFRILRPHAKGGLGEVFVACDEELNREVALKEIQAKYADHAESRARFLLEAEVTGSLEHPGVVPVYGLGRYPDGRPYYAMRFIRGDSLKEAIAAFHKEKATLPAGDRALHLHQLLRRFIDVCNAIAYAHSRGVLHRDLKPGNVMLGKYGETLVVDWGLAKVMGRPDIEAAEPHLSTTLSGGGDSAMTALGSALGTPAYMSPEQAEGRLADLGPASDVYSLGATLYCLLTGQPPFGSGDIVQLLERVRRGEYPRPRELDREIHPALEAICRKAMAVRPGDRYPSAQALAEDVERWLAEEPVTAYREPLLARLRRWRRRHHTAVSVTAFVLLTVIAAAVVGGAIRGREQARARAVALVDTLADAAAPNVPALVKDVEAHRADAAPRLRERWQDPALTDAQRLRLGLALADDPEVRARLVALARTTDDPREVLLVRDALVPHAAEAAPPLWEQVADRSTPATERFRLLVILAALAPDDGRWAAQAGEVVRFLVHENVLVVSGWAEALRPVRGRLVAPLERVYRDAARPESERSLAVSLLADYAADSPQVLTDLLLDADAKQYAVLFPLLEWHPEQAARLLDEELSRQATWGWHDAPLDPAWGAADPAVVREVEAAGGLVVERFALCQALPLARFDPVAAGLRRAGYRPVRLRPYAVAASVPLAGSEKEPASEPLAATVRVAAVWARDGRDVQASHGLTADEVRHQDGERRRQGYQPADVAGYRTADGDRYAVLWIKAGADEEAHFYVGLSADQKSAGSEPLRKADLNPVASQTFLGSDGVERYSAVYRKNVPSSEIYWGEDAGTYAARCLANGQPVDVCVSSNREYAEWARTEVLAWLSGSPWAGLALHRRPPPVGHPERGYSGVFLGTGAFDHALALGLAPEEQRRRCRELAEQGYRPAALAAATLPGSGEVLTASVWYRPAVPDEARERLAQRQANAAVTLLRLGHGDRVWPLLRHTPDPRLRSYLIHRLSPLGAGVQAVVRRFAEEPDVSARRALLLCLGEFTPEQLPAADRAALVPTVLALYRDDPDSGMHGAAEWLLRQWHQEARLREADRALATGKPEGSRRWYVNGQGQTLAVIDGGEFLMGSPRSEAGRQGGAERRTEMQHRVRVGRRFALATKELTVEQFLRFNKGRFYDRQYAPTPEYPMGTLQWYEAAAYCNWLSQQEGIPEDQWCYLPNDRGEYGDGMRTKPNYLSLTGYRLPTEAEWEYACRAGAVTSRYYGETEALLDRYAWYSKNSEERGLLLPGSLKPNDLGLFDLYGNAQEWCADGFTPLFTLGPHGEPLADRASRADARGILVGRARMVRGGSFTHWGANVRSAARSWHPPNSTFDNDGFRPARTLP